jgi:hypothetical protein
MAGDGAKPAPASRHVDGNKHGRTSKAGGGICKCDAHAAWQILPLNRSDRPLTDPIAR